MKIRIYTAIELQNLLIVCSNIFDENEKFSQSDRIISSAIEKFEGNNSLDVVLPKVIIINSFYSTQIYDTNKMAKHIVKLDIVHKLTIGELSLVDSIRVGHGIKSKKNARELNFYSFTTKYTALHQPSKFPIFDSLVKRLLTALNRKISFTNKFIQSDLINYHIFVKVIDDLIEFTKLNSYKYKKLDQGLWVLAKYFYDQTNLTQKDIMNIESTI